MPDATIRNATNHTLNIAFGVVAPLEDGNGVVHGKTIKLNLAMFVHSVELKTLTNVLIPRCPSFPKVALLSKNVDEGFDTRLFKFPKVTLLSSLSSFHRVRFPYFTRLVLVFFVASYSLINQMT